MSVLLSLVLKACANSGKYFEVGDIPACQEKIHAIVCHRKKKAPHVGRRWNPSTDGFCAGEDPCNVCQMLHKNAVPRIGRDLRFPHYPCFWGLPYLKKTAILLPSLSLHPLMQSTSPAHSASLTRLHPPALWSSAQCYADLTHTHQHLSWCRGSRGNIPRVVSGVCWAGGE